MFDCLLVVGGLLLGGGDLALEVANERILVVLIALPGLDEALHLEEHLLQLSGHFALDRVDGLLDLL